MRRFLASSLALSLAFTSLVALAQAPRWPTKPVRMYVGFSTGTSTDVVARIVADGVSPRLGQPLVVENRPGRSEEHTSELQSH